MGEKKEYVKLWLSYRSYFESYSAAEVGRLVLAAMDYRESGAEPEFSGSERFIWPAIRRDIDESITAQRAISDARSTAGKQGGRPETEKANAFSESKEKQKKQMLFEESKKSNGQRKRTKEKDMVKDEGKNIPPLAPLSPCLKSAVEEWLTYKDERKERYQPTGLKKLVSQIQRSAELYGETAMIDVIDRSIAANYRGIVFDWLEKEKGRDVFPDTEPFLDDNLSPGEQAEEIMKDVDRHMMGNPDYEAKRRTFDDEYEAWRAAALPEAKKRWEDEHGTTDI